MKNVVFFGVAWGAGLLVYSLLAGEMSRIEMVIIDSWKLGIPLLTILVSSLALLKRRTVAAEWYFLPLCGGVLGFVSALFSVFVIFGPFVPVVSGPASRWTSLFDVWPLMIPVSIIDVVAGVVYGSLVRVSWRRQGA